MARVLVHYDIPSEASVDFSKRLGKYSKKFKQLTESVYEVDISTVGEDGTNDLKKFLLEETRDIASTPGVRVYIERPQAGGAKNAPYIETIVVRSDD